MLELSLGDNALIDELAPVDGLCSSVFFNTRISKSKFLTGFALALRMLIVSVVLPPFVVVTGSNATFWHATTPGVAVADGVGELVGCAVGVTEGIFG